MPRPRLAQELDGRPDVAEEGVPPPPFVLIGHAASFTPY